MRRPPNSSTAVAALGLGGTTLALTIGLASVWPACAIREIREIREEIIADETGELKNYFKGRTFNFNNPIVWVPGITSSSLRARVVGPIPDFCKGFGGPPQDGQWYTLYVNAPMMASSPGCFLYAMTLQPPDKPGGCVKDAPGIEVDDVGFGEGRPTINPSDPMKVHLFDRLIATFEAMGLKQGETIRFATYDWRKYGDPCWEDSWMKRLKNLIEDMSDKENKPVVIGCHSMGCPLVHLFLNTVNRRWKRHFVSEFVATGPAFAGSTQILQNFISGPSYAMMPLAASHIGRSAMTSMPGFYTLAPARGQNAWSEDFVMVSTPWKNYTIASLYDGSFWDDVEGKEEEGSNAEQVFAAGSIEDDPSHARPANAINVGRSEWLLTEQGCVCHTPCENSLTPLVGTGSVLPKLLEHAQLLEGLSRNWCWTVGNCGNTQLFHSQHWDYCGELVQSRSGGPGFEFFPGVAYKDDAWYKNIPLVGGLFGTPDSYRQLQGMAVEAMKQACLDDEKCTGFNTNGWLSSGVHEPGSTWQGIARVSDGMIQGLYIKRTGVADCQRKHMCNSRQHSEKVCGTDGRSYESECHLLSARCWNASLEVKHNGACIVDYKTPQGCSCMSHGEGVLSDGCGTTTKLLPSEVPLVGTKLPLNNQKWCVTSWFCGHRVGVFTWDFCMDYGGIDTGMGFEFFSKSWVEGAVLRPAPDVSINPISMDELQLECGADPACGGFLTDGTLLTHRFSKDPQSWFVPSDGAKGVYRKQDSVVHCQRDCKHDKGVPVCLAEPGGRNSRTFCTACMADNFLCLPGRKGSYRQGPCTRPGSSGMHLVARKHLQRVSKLSPPDVPTTCAYITDVDTQASWRFKDFLSSGVAMSNSRGDGTVNLESMEGPCKMWQNVSGHPPVRLFPIELGGSINHVTMLLTDGFWKELSQIVNDVSWLNLTSSLT